MNARGRIVRLLLMATIIAIAIISWVRSSVRRCDDDGDDDDNAQWRMNIKLSI